MAFADAFDEVVGIEGKYSNNPADRGGPTMWGITERVARANGYKDDMKDMPRAVAKTIYKKQYWDINKLDDIAKLSDRLANKMFESGVNLGTSWSATALQRILNVLNRNQRDYPDIPQDGQIGPMTVSDLKLLFDKRGTEGELTTLTAFRSLQGAKYIGIAEANPTQEEFAFGWISKRVGG